jgi:hypothetical protein
MVMVVKMKLEVVVALQFENLLACFVKELGVL